jgi:CheY-like chemotaxis protein
VAEAELSAGASPQESLAEIARGALRAGELTKRLLTFAREEPVRQVSLDLGAVVREAASLVRPTMPRGTELEVAIASGLPPVLGDSTQLHQVVVNLITNAGQALAGRDHGRISVSVEQIVLGERRTGVVAGLDAGEYLRLRVVDDGPGIPEAIIGRVFDPFFTTKGPNEGTGLGLAAVHSIVRNHRGVIAAEHHRAGGACLTAYLPVQSSPERPATVAEPAPPLTGAQPVARVLFVDDEEALVRLAYRAMPYCGCEVAGFTDPLEAAEAFAADPTAFDAVITDLSMPGLTGLELTERVRAIRGDVPVVLTSGYMASGDQVDAERRGVSAIMPKPCSIEDLASEVLRLLAD